MYQTTVIPAIMPKSATASFARFLRSQNTSRSGAFESLPSAFMRANAGDSCIDRRIHIDTASMPIDTQNGMRQPQVSKASPMSERQARITPSDRRRPTVAVVWIQLV